MSEQGAGSASREQAPARPLRVLWHSVAPWVPTGYGTQTAQAVPRLQALGCEVAISAYYGHQGGMLRWRGLPVYPAYGVSYGNDVLIQHALHHFGADGGPPARSIGEASARGLVLLLGDCWTFDAPLLPELAVAAWTPVDHLQPPDVVLRWFAWTRAVPIAMSRFGQAALAEFGVDSLYVPHAVETAVFHPGDRAEARAAVGVPEDAFVVAIVGANVGRDSSRKAFADQLAAFGRLRQRHTDALLVLHTDVDSPVGVRLRGLLESLPPGSWRFTDQYAYRQGIPPAQVAAIYQAADVLSNCSMGEGFGLPIVEAQACGTPVIVTDATSMPELCGAGWKVGYEPYWHDMQGGWAAKPLIAEIAQAMEEAYKGAEALRDAAAAFGMGYDADLVAGEHWAPTVERLRQALAERTAALQSAPAGPAAERVVAADGLWWLDRGARSDDAIGHQPHEAELQPLLLGLLPDGGTLLDVGAHVGHWALRLARARGARVVAVEANPATAATLRRHVAMNDLGGQVTVVELAAWDRPANLRLEDPGAKLEGGSTRTLPLEKHRTDEPHDCVLMACPGYERTIRGGRLDVQLTDAALGGRLDVVKLDVEGADLHALRGMERLLRRYQPTLFIERHDIYGDAYYRLEDLLATLDHLGYDVAPAGDAGLAVAYLIGTPKEGAHHAHDDQAAAHHRRRGSTRR